MPQPWAPSPEEEERYYNLLVKSKILHKRSVGLSLMLIEKKLNVKAAMAYRVLNHLKTKGWIQTVPAIVLNVDPRKKRN
jgi:hypothetical protein